MLKKSNKQLGFKENYLYSLSYQILILITPFITTPYVSRVLGVENIGVYSYTSSLVAYFTMVAAMGTNMYGQREIAYNANNKHVKSIRFWEIELYKAMTVAIAIVAYFVFIFAYQQYTTALIIQSIAIIDVLFDITWFYQGMSNFKTVTVRNFCIKLISIASIFLFVKSSDDIYIYSLINVLATFIGNLILWFNLPKEIERVRLNELKPFANIRTILELFIPLIATKVYNVLDKTMLGAITNDTVENGYYEQTTKVINICMALITAMGPVLLPEIAREFADNHIDVIKKKVNEAYHYTALIACPVCLGIVSISSYMTTWFYGPGYEKVGLLLKIYAWVLIIIPLSNMAGYAVLNPTKQHNKGTIAVCAGAVTNLILNSILIPRFQSVGASIATIAAESVVTIIYLYFIKGYVDYLQLAKSWGKCFACSGVMAAVIIPLGFALNSVGCPALVINLIQMILGASIYFLLILVVVKDEVALNLVKSVFGKIRGVLKR